VYDPCVLASKKRYVGRMFEDVGARGHLDAKGIEVVRRDQCAIVVKMQEKVLRILFATRDLSQVRRELVREGDRERYR
jgi:DNA polymerase zeta